MPAPIIFRDLSGLSEGITSLGSSLGDALKVRGERAFKSEKEKAENEKKIKGINAVSNWAANYDSTRSPMENMGSLKKLVEEEGVEPSFLEPILKTVLEKSVSQEGKMFGALNNVKSKVGLGTDNKDELVELLTRFNIPPDQAEREAELYIALPTGGKTQYANMFFDRMQRGSIGSSPGSNDTNAFKGLGGEVIDNSQKVVERGIQGQEVIEEKQQEYVFPDVKNEVFQERTPRERAKFKGEILKQNTEKYSESYDALLSAEDEMFRFKQMSELNQSGKLPEGLEAVLNVNHNTGEVTFPRLSNPETQAYVKLVNDFTTKAKDSYGARVTNFELQRFLKRLPTLANDTDGRQLILEQLQMATEINQLEAQAITEAFDHYGTQGVTQDIAQREARKKIKPRVEEIRERAIKNLSEQDRLETQKRTAPGNIPVKKPDGSKGQIPADKREEAIKKGWKIL